MPNKICMFNGVFNKIFSILSYVSVPFPTKKQIPKYFLLKSNCKKIHQKNSVFKNGFQSDFHADDSLVTKMDEFRGILILTKKI